MGLLEGRIALITGAGGGIGKGVARRFAREGASVVVAEIDVASGEQVVRELEELGGRALFVRTDVTSKESVVAAVNAAAVFQAGNPGGAAGEGREDVRFARIEALLEGIVPAPARVGQGRQRIGPV